MRIDSLGGVRDRDYTFGEGLTVLYGPNESGKTTTMEFMRSVLSPNPSKRKTYPERRKTDSGMLEYVEGGEVRRLELSSKDVVGEAPACLEGMDPELYRSIFAMDPRTLDEDGPITKGGIKSRFLTVPGGEGMSEAMDSVDGDVKRILGVRKGRSELQDMEASMGDLEASVDAKRVTASGYGEKAAELEETRRRADSLRASSSAEQRDRDTVRLYESNRENYERLASLRGERAGLGDFRTVTPEDEGERARLERALSAADAVVASSQRRTAALTEELGGADPRKVGRSGSAIDALPARLEQYRRDSEELEELERVPPAPAPVRRVGKLTAVGAVIALAGMVLAATVTVYAAVLAVAGVVVAVAPLVRGRAAAPSGPVRDEARISQLRGHTSAFRSDVEALARELGLGPGDVEGTVARLGDLRRAARDLSRTQIEDMRVRQERAEASAALSVFLAGFAGAEGFDESLRRTRRAAELDRRISELTEAIRSAGLDPERPECPVTWEDTGTQEAIREADRRVGELEAELRAILAMSDLEADMDRLELMRSERDRLLDSGATAVIASVIAEAACSTAYSTVQPAVVTRAGGYLAMMTGGECRLAVDPKTDAMSTVDADGSRQMSEWSSGLRAQVLLSLKLAIAHEMGGGEVPVILDDVLLPFDSARKEGAIRALAGISADMQVIMFTCDAETRHIALSTDGAICLRM